MIAPNPTSQYETTLLACFKAILLISVGLVSANCADGGVLFTIEESTRGVSLVGSGSYDLTGAQLVHNTLGPLRLNRSGVLALGSAPQLGDAYALTDVSARSFGNGSIVGATLSTGGGLAIAINEPLITVPAGYTSETQLSGTAFLNGATLGSLALFPGEYLYELPNDTVTVNIIPVPEPGPCLGFAAGLSALFFSRRRKDNLIVRAE